MKTIGIIDYGAGNFGSVANVLRKIGVSYEISNDTKILRSADALILPGDGAAETGMENLKKNCLVEIIKQSIKTGKPFLGICLGMQLLMDFSEEGNVKCLGIISGRVSKLKTTLKIPQIGWNNVRHSGYHKGTTFSEGSQVEDTRQSARMTLFENVYDDSYFYFIHSYICVPEDASIITGTTDYGETFCSALEKNNIVGVQFHPEKSGKAGLQLLENFISGV